MKEGFPTYIDEELAPRLRAIDNRMYSSIRHKLLVRNNDYLKSRPLKSCPLAPARAARQAKAAKK